jgi:hypothetical protein
MNKRRYWLWRAVDQDGTVLDILVQGRRDQHAAERFLRCVLDGDNDAQPRVVVTDKLASYPPALRRVLPKHGAPPPQTSEQQAENSHRPVRKRERTMQGIQVARAGAAGPGDRQPGVQPVPAKTAPADSQQLPTDHARPIQAVAGCCERRDEYYTSQLVSASPAHRVGFNLDVRPPTGRGLPDGARRRSVRSWSRHRTLGSPPREYRGGHFRASRSASG